MPRKMLATTTVVAAMLAVPAVAQAGGGADAGSTTSGGCSASATWKLDVKERDGGLEVEFEVDSNVVGQSWAYRIARNGSLATQGTAVTTAPSGSFSAEVALPGAKLADSISATATQAGGGQSCDTSGGSAGPGPGADDNPGTDDGPGAKGSAGSGRRSRVAGECSSASDWTLKTKRRDGRIELELEVDANRSGQDWRYKVLRDGAVAKRGHATTSGRSGSFSIEHKLADGPGRQSFRAVAKHAASGEVCRTAALTR